MYCICCGKANVSPEDILGEKSEEDLLWMNEKRNNTNITIDNEMVNGGIIQIINAGYGSNHDGDQIIIAICDDCITKNLEDGTLLYFGNYMGWPGQKEDCEKSKKILRRRKNLDGLV